MEAALHLTMPTSFEDAFLDRLAERRDAKPPPRYRVEELYGALPRSVVGSGRPPASVPDVDERAFARHVAAARERGFRFTVLFNAACTGNVHHDPTGRRRVVAALAFARDAGCAAVVIAHPDLVELARMHVPELRVHVSSIAFVKSVRQARGFQRLGARRLVLDPDTIRDFRFLARLRRGCPDLEIEALANHPCLLHCPYESACYNAVAHASQDHADAPFSATQLVRCTIDRLRDPVEFLRGSWMRPSDARLYEEAGVTALKLAGRGRSTDWLLGAADAYQRGVDPPDLLEWIWPAQWAAAWRAIGRPERPRPVRLEARALAGFLPRFHDRNLDCSKSCDGCSHCPDFAARALSVDEEGRRACLEELEEGLARLLA